MTRRGGCGRPVTSASAQAYLDRAIGSLRQFLRLRHTGEWRSDPGMLRLARMMVRWNVGRVRFWRARLAGALRRERARDGIA